MLKITDIKPGASYACKFRIQTVVDENNVPVPNLLGGKEKKGSLYEGLGIMLTRDLENNLVKVFDQSCSKTFVVSIDDIWDIDTIEWVDPLDSNDPGDRSILPSG